MAKADGRPYSAQNSTADKALDILRMFTDTRPVLSAADVAKELGTSRSTTYRYLQSLRQAGFLEEDKDYLGFRLGPAIFELARIARKGLGLSEVALPVMQDLAQRLGETVILTRRMDNRAVVIECELARRPIRVSYERGQSFPLHAGASSRMLLAFVPEVELDRILGHLTLERFTDRTICDLGDLRKSLVVTRNQGYTVSRGEVDEGVESVAAPILDANQLAIAGLAVVTLEAKWGSNKRALGPIVEAVQECSAEIGRELAKLRQ